MKVRTSLEKKNAMIDALHLIKDECVMCSNAMTDPNGGVIYECGECSFFSEGECLIRAELPKFWSLADDDGDRTWRAFL